MRITLVLSLCALLPGADWTGFHGPNGSGVAADDSAPSDLSISKGLLWKAPLPAGNSSPIVVRNRVFVTAWDGDNRLVVALDAGTGKEVWRRSTPKRRTEFAMVENGHATPSMVSDGVNVYAMFHDLGLLSFTFDGKERWSVPLGPFSSPYGLASSLAAADGKVFLWTDMQEEALLRAYDAATGKLRWTAKQQAQAGGGYSSPIVYRPKKGPAQVIVFGAGETAGYQASTGERLWWAHGLTSQPVATPIVDSDTLFVVSPKSPPFPWAEVAAFDVKKDGRIPVDAIPQDKPMNIAWKRLLGAMEKSYGDGDGVLTRAEHEKGAAAMAEFGGLTAVPLTGKGDLSKCVRWRVTKSLSYYTSPLVYRGVLYTVRDGAIVSSFDPNDGKIHKQGRLPDAAGQYWGSPVAGDGRLFFVNGDGKLTMARADAQWEPLTSADLQEPVLTTPALAGGRLYVRGSKHLFCFGRN